MKTLIFERDEKKDRVTVTCKAGPVSVYSKCAYCKHCRGVQIGNRIAPAPQSKALIDVRKGSVSDDILMNAALMFNSLIREGSAIVCDDDSNSGYVTLY